MELRDNLATAQRMYAETGRAGFEFVKADLDTALTFAQIASQGAEGSEKRVRNRQRARTGHDAIVKFRQRLDPRLASAEELEDMDAKIQELKAALAALGEQV